MKFLFWIILIFLVLSYGMKLFMRYGLPWLLGRFMKKQQEKFNRGYDQRQDTQQQRREGDVEINVPSAKAQKKDTGFGEYIEFEDVDDQT
ncbi:MAG: hypothetical protein L3J31_03690 [Bacteroidales bacterium]|nr:hypothetical protein [Bacteroidales bacterium]